MAPVSDRSHLSIGEVLSLLQDEFPDVTISKIRFLESQGLLDPERTPSGYRKFYEVDIVRLRWILRQQRENFLPLKVIKDRLAAGEVDFNEDIVAEPPGASSTDDSRSAGDTSENPTPSDASSIDTAETRDVPRPAVPSVSRTAFDRPADVASAREAAGLLQEPPTPRGSKSTPSSTSPPLFDTGVT